MIFPRIRKIGSSRLRLSPPGVLVVLYLAVIAFGAALLLLPIAHDGTLRPSDAFFTSTSAVTVTGLIVVDTGSVFTPFGEAVIAGLIQFGGLGLMVYAVLILSAFGIPLGMPQKVMLREDLNQATISNLGKLVRLIAVIALGTELVGAALLALVFVPDLGWGEGLWQAVFHSISAFNNAGFSLFPDSLIGYVGDPLVNVVITLMFIGGGLGFIVIGDLYQKRRWRTLTLHSKIMLAGTAALIVLGTLGFGLLEWNNPATMGQLSTGEKLWASWFQGVTPRTAGFNSINTAGMHEPTTLLTMILMVIGGGSTSTAGGIKVTTAVVMVLATVAFFRRRSHLHLFGRSLGGNELMKVMALSVVSVGLLFAGLFVLTLSHEGEFLDRAFEVASAFGTVGLSRGVTAELDTAGRVTIMAIMFLGRVGPLSLGFFLATRAAPRVRYPAGEIYLG